jgi:hypothetical protein
MRLIGPLILMGFCLAAAPLAHAQSADTLQSRVVPSVASPAAAPAVEPPRIGGYLQMRETWAGKAGLNATLNRARLSAEGPLPSQFSYRFLIEYEAAGATSPALVSLRDALIRWTHAPWTISAGQYKTPFSREYLTSITTIETADRAAVVDSLAPKRDIGVMADYAFGSLGTASAGVFNGEGQNAIANRDSAVLVVERLVLRPVAGITLGVSGAHFGDDSTRVGVEGSLEWRGFLVRGEAIQQHRLARAAHDRGSFVLTGWRVLPWLQLVAKGEEYRRAVTGNVKGIRAGTVGANFDLPGGRTRAIVDYVMRRSDPGRTDRRALITQLQVRF